MRTISRVEPEDEFLECMESLGTVLGVKRVMLTGGEPTVHPRLRELVDALQFPFISMTSNGIRLFGVEEWEDLKGRGLSKLIVSMHDASVQSFLDLETRKRDMGWAIRALEAQRTNIVHASKAGLAVRVNVVAYHSASHTLEVLRSIEEIQREWGFEVRVLNDLSNLAASQGFIQQVCETLEASEQSVYRRAGSSNVTRHLTCPSGFAFSVKLAYPYFFNPVCSKCLIKDTCHEGFYGVRIERRGIGYWVRLCIYKHSGDVLMPWRVFLDSGLAEEMRGGLSKEFPGLSPT